MKDQNQHSNAAIKYIDIQPFSGIENESVNYVYRELKKVLSHVSIKKTAALPSFAFYKLRNRYKADSILTFLKVNADIGHTTIGLTDKDISTTKGAIADWGVMGLGNCPGNTCVVSTFRLSKSERLMQLFKVSIHELGHTEGLPHCPVKYCFMRDAEGHNTTNEETAFCPKCKAFLVDKGWQFN
ncbi:MAG: hypothetical protein ABIP30_00475 [Ferruginibacter sp.]